MKKIVLTGDRPTGRLHLGHYVGSLRNRVKMQESGEYELYIMIADMQALTDNASNPQKVSNNVKEVLLDYLAVGLDPKVTHLFVQSGVTALPELTMYYMNLVNLGRLQRNPTIKTEIKLRGFESSIPVGFLCYPVSQASDITAFDAEVVPVGEDQIPIHEQVLEIVKSFNNTYGETLVVPKALVPESKCERRLPGLDGKEKMSKSVNNCIYLSDNSEIVYKKVMSMYTDPNHLNIDDPGDTENNPVFIYLDALCTDREKFEELKNSYAKGGVGDVTIKKYLYEVIENTLTPIREKRDYYYDHYDEALKFLKEGTIEANKKANVTLNRVRKVIGVEYFD